MKTITKVVAALLSVALLAPLVSAKGADDKIKVMSRNIYLGADIFPVLAAAQDPDPFAIPLAVTEVFQTVQQTNFPERAGALADEIARYSPDVIGLQEVSVWYTQIPGDFLAGNPAQASDVAYDYLTILMANLEARGLEYEVATSLQNADLELPFVAGVTEAGPILGDVRLVDRDVVLVKSGVEYSNVFQGNYSNNGSVDLGGVSAEFTRGYNMLDVNVKGGTYRFVNTHLEVGGSEPFITLQAAQMFELLQLIDATSNPSVPVIMLGDFNSDPSDQPFVSAITGQLTAPPYMQANLADYVDAWTQQKKADEGFTCCFDASVADEAAELTSRIDHVFVKTNGRELKKVKMKVVGDTTADMTDINSLYPSDHAGVYGKIRFED
jgi:endonuclease/exonuclease/phosphatase family metal-dependent hydrolase